MVSDYSLVIRPDALADIERTAEWYEEREPGLGTAFTRSILQAIDELPANPLIYRQRDRHRNVRWFFPRRFPYRIIYEIRNDTITIFAVLHSARNNSHWKQRLINPPR